VNIFKNIIIIISFCSSNILICQDANFIWAKNVGGANNTFAKSTVIDSVGNTYITGHFAGVVDFDPGIGVYNLTSNGYFDIFILKLDAFGNFIWAKNIGGSNNDSGNSLAIDSEANLYITGDFAGVVDFNPGSVPYILNGFNTSDFFILKLDSSANFIFAKQIISSGAYSFVTGNSIFLDASLNIYTTGDFSGSADFDPGINTFSLSSIGYNNVFVSKLNAFGDFIWAKQYSGTSSNSQSYGNSILIDLFGNIYTMGYFYGIVDFDPAASTYTLESTGGIIDRDIFITKLDSFGNFIWAKQMGGLDEENGLSFVTDNMGNVYSTGYFDATADFDPGIGIYDLTPNVERNIYISKLDSGGNFLWANQISGYGYGRSVALDAMKNVYVTGFFQGLTDFDSGPGVYYLDSPIPRADGFINKLDSNGNFIWVKQLVGNGSSNSSGLSIIVDSYNNIYTTGNLTGTVDFDPGINNYNMTSFGWMDCFVHKMSQDYTLNIVEGYTKNNIGLFPNPSNRQINVFLNNKEEIIDIKLINSSGQILMEKNKIYSNISNFDVSNLADGIYFFEVTTYNHAIHRTKFVKN
jgi:hypothetical protein